MAAFCLVGIGGFLLLLGVYPLRQQRLALAAMSSAGTVCLGLTAVMDSCSVLALVVTSFAAALCFGSVLASDSLGGNLYTGSFCTGAAASCLGGDVYGGDGSSLFWQQPCIEVDSVATCYLSAYVPGRQGLFGDDASSVLDIGCSGFRGSITFGSNLASRWT